MAYFPPTGSVVTFQSDPTKLVGTVSIVGSMNASITAFQGGNWITSVVNTVPSSMLVGASIIGISPVSQGGVWIASVFGNVSVLGTVPVTQSGVWTTSVVNTVPSSMLVGASIIGVVPVTGLVNSSVVVNNILTGNSSVQLISTSASVATQVNNILTGNSSVQLISTSASIAVLVNRGGASVVVNNILTGNSSVQVISGVGVIGSVAVLQGTNPWITGFGLSPSIVGTYAEDAAHTSADKGVFVLAARNDTLGSVTTTDLDYSPITVGPIGEVVTANSPITKWIQATTSIMANVSVQAVAAQGASIFTYITGVQVANTSPNNALVKFTGGLGGDSSILGYAPAPASGGAVFTIPNAWKTGQNSGVSASVSSAAASVFISLQGFIAKI